MITFYIIASELAKITGHNTFDIKKLGEEIANNKLKEEILVRSGLLKKDIPKTNIERKLSVLENDKIESLKKDFKAKDIKDLSIKIKKDIIDESLNTNLKEEESRDKIIEKVKGKEILNNDLLDEINQDLGINRGIVRENYNLNIVEKKENKLIKERNNILYNKILYKCECFKIVLRGMVDGVCEDSIVETKNRKHRLFNKIPDYEKVQLNAYMFLTDKNKVKHTEHYNNTYNIIEYEYDNIFWNECKQNIITYVTLNFQDYF